MEITRWAGHDDLGEGKTAQHRGNGRRGGIPLARVANKREICFQFIRIGIKEWCEARRAAFFFTFKQDGDRDRKASRF